MMTRQFADGMKQCPTLGALALYTMGGITAAVKFEKNDLDAMDTIREMLVEFEKNIRRINRER